MSYFNELKIFNKAVNKHFTSKQLLVKSYRRVYIFSFFFLFNKTVYVCCFQPRKKIIFYFYNLKNI